MAPSTSCSAPNSSSEFKSKRHPLRRIVAGALPRLTAAGGPMKKLATLVVVSLSLAGSAHAEIQKSGPEVWPGKVMLGVRPAGVGLVFDAGGGGPGRGTPGFGAYYKVGIDIAGRLKEFSKASLWLGGEVNVGGRGNFATIEPGVFVMVTLEKLLNIPLVPMLSFGISGPIYIPYGFNGAFLYGAFQAKFGGGVYYFLT